MRTYTSMIFDRLDCSPGIAVAEATECQRCEMTCPKLDLPLNVTCYIDIPETRPAPR